MRENYDKLLAWKLQSRGETALLIEGARRIGKSTNTWPAPNNHVYEIDFLLSHGFKLWPIEVKSAGYSTHKSLDEFCKKFSHRVGDRFLAYTKDMRKDAETLMIPIYMVGLL